MVQSTADAGQDTRDFNEKGVPVGAVTDATAATGATTAIAQALVTLCWSSGAAGIAFGRLLGPLTEELYRRPDDFNDKDLATLVFALKGWWPREQLHLRDAAMLRVKTEASRRDLPITADMLRTGLGGVR
ncbi:unnamed protein product [Effrenium voratum]|uniref:Uncharacterized protein n=1 Tax=Effrenium voratum TaxID=2562239 RepID=A0AA36J2P2_9DINO|nr:unnamed protein product [Effrenium voratum]